MMWDCLRKTYYNFILSMFIKFTSLSSVTTKGHSNISQYQERKYTVLFQTIPLLPTVSILCFQVFSFLFFVYKILFHRCSLTSSATQLAACFCCFLVWLTFEPEDGCDMSLQYVRLALNYMRLQARRLYSTWNKDIRQHL